ncbi:MAG TPA: NADH-quinone oxidoreductase subunit N, partial [Anaerolineaceae bacterium]|nr:NADH-quinone oxidoreductase subunit N [Anaerolineaceae bacterium]
MSWNDLYVLLPMLVVIAWALVLLLVDLWIPRGNKGITAGLAAIGMAAALGLTLSQRGQSLEGFGSMAVLDSFSVYMNVIILVAGLAAVALALDYLKKMEIERGEYYVLLMISVSGMMLMTQAHDLIMVFLALEMLSMPLYVLAGFDSNRFASGEAALKYFLLGAFTSGFLLYGVALIFGATSYTSFSGIIQSVQAGTVNMPLFVVGVGLVLAAFGFKVAAVPFQMWTPDVYQGAPSPVTAFMSVGVKAAAFAALMRVFLALFPSLAANLAPILAVLSALTMIVGNVLAI